jgi:hypothetical protein
MEKDKTIPVGVTVLRLGLLIILQLLKQVAHIVEREGPNAQQLLSIKHPHHEGLEFRYKCRASSIHMNTQIIHYPLFVHVYRCTCSLQAQHNTSSSY